MPLLAVSEGLQRAPGNGSRTNHNSTIDDIYFAPVIISRDTIIIQKSIPPLSALGNDTSVCEGSIVKLQATTQNCKILWNTGETTPIIQVSESGTYSLKLKDIYGCSTYDSINVTKHQYPFINLGSDTSICDNTPLTLNLSDDNFSYIWQNQSTQNTMIINEAGKYWATGKNNGCNSSDTINIRIKSSPVFTLGSDTTLKNRVPFIISPTVEGKYLWNDGSTSKSYLSRTQEKITLTVTSVNQCINTAEININRFKVVTQKIPVTNKKIKKVKQPTIIGYSQKWDVQKNKWTQKAIVKPLAYIGNIYLDK